SLSAVGWTGEILSAIMRHESVGVENRRSRKRAPAIRFLRCCCYFEFEQTGQARNHNSRSSLKRPIRPFSGRCALATDGCIDIATEEEWQSPIENPGIRST